MGCRFSKFRERICINAGRTEFAFDLHQPIVFCEALTARQRPGLDLAASHCDGKVGNDRIFSLAGPVGNYVLPAGVPAHLNRLDRLRDGSDLVRLDEDSIGRTLLNSRAG